MNIVQQIIEWTKLKCRIQIRDERPPYFREREIWWASIGANVGSELNGKNELFDRPVLIVRKFNEDMLWVLPMTTTESTSVYYYPTSHAEGQKQAKVALSQIRTISSKRLIKKQRTLPEPEYDEVLRRMRDMFTKKSTP